jgi:hypothetical protein
MLRIDLNVPFHEKDAAKRLGARWDADRKTWFAPDGADLGAFERWLPKPPHVNVRSSMYWIVTSSRQCWKCARVTDVFAFALPGDHRVLEFREGLPPEHAQMWERGEMRVLPYYIEYLAEGVQARIREITPHYRLDFSQTTASSYWMNHCAFCGIKQGDYELFCEPGSAFMPMTPKDASAVRTARIFEPFEACAGEFSCEPEFL